MRILHIEGGKNLYGGAYQVLQLVKLLADRATNILACPKGSAIESEAAKVGAVVTPISLNGEGSFGAYFELRHLIGDLKPDIVHVHSRRGADLWGVLAAARSHVPLVITRRVDNREPRLLASLRYTPAIRVVGISEAICEVLNSEGVPSSKLRAIRSGIDTDEYKPVEGKAYLGEQFGIRPDESVVVMAAQFIKRKGHATLISAIPNILARRPNTRFLLPGKGALLETIRRAAAPFGDRVLIPGFRSDFNRILPECDILAHPAEMEGLGVVILQASACGVPVVTTRAGGIPEVVRNGRNGFLISPNNPDLLASRINSLLADDTLREGMRRYARDYAIHELSIKVMADANFALYKEILEEMSR